MKLYLFLFALCNVTILFGQADNKNVRPQAERYAAAFEHGDIKSLIEYIHPNVVEKFGGRADMMEMMDERMKDIKSRGASFDPSMIGQPSKAVKAGNETHCLISLTQVIKRATGKSSMENTLLAVTRDNGNHWYFINMQEYDQESIKAVLPNFNSQLKIPAKKQLQFVPN